MVSGSFSSFTLTYGRWSNPVGGHEIASDVAYTLLEIWLLVEVKG